MLFIYKNALRYTTINKSLLKYLIDHFLKKLKWVFFLKIIILSKKKHVNLFWQLLKNMYIIYITLHKTLTLHLNGVQRKLKHGSQSVGEVQRPYQRIEGVILLLFFFLKLLYSLLFNHLTNFCDGAPWDSLDRGVYLVEIFYSYLMLFTLIKKNVNVLSQMHFICCKYNFKYELIILM